MDRQEQVVDAVQVGGDDVEQVDRIRAFLYNHMDLPGDTPAGVRGGVGAPGALNDLVWPMQPDEGGTRGEGLEAVIEFPIMEMPRVYREASPNDR